MKTNWIVALVLAAALVLPVVAGAHEGHVHKALGTISVINGEHVEIKTTDGKNLTVMLDKKTTVTVYSLRAKNKPTVSTPLKWSEVKAALPKGRSKGKPPVFEADEVLRRVKKWGDLFAPVLELKQTLPRARSE